jgi:hypothetical protein
MRTLSSVLRLAAAGFLLLATAAAGAVPVAAAAPAQSPPPSPRFSAGAAYDGARHDLVLFGGETLANGGLTVFGDTWSWNGHRWTQRTPAHSPSARAFAEMAYDPVHRQVVLFGGIDGAGTFLADTWLWDGADWTEATPAFTPASTIEQGITFFPRTGTVIMFSGNSFTGRHMYSWDGANWTDLPFTGGPPASAFQGGLSLDPVRPVLVLLASDVNQPALQHWEFDGTTWTHRDLATPPKRSLVQTAADQRTHTIVMFGGVQKNDTWTWDGTAWTQRQPRHSPSVRTSTGPMPVLAYDAGRGKVVVFGGVDFFTNVSLNDTWTWNGRDWKQVA